MKLLFISPRFSGGIGGHAAMLAEKLSQNGHQVKKLETSHIPIKNLKNPSFAVLSSLKSIVDRESYDIVHGFNIPSAYAMKYAKGKKKFSQFMEYLVSRLTHYILNLFHPWQNLQNLKYYNGLIN